MRLAKEIARLRSWGEGGWRSAGFLVGYFFAWYYNILTASFLSFLSLLILVPSTRLLFFPPVAMPLTTSKDSTIPPSDPLGPSTSTSSGVDGILPGSDAQREVEVERMAGDFADGLEAVLVSAGATENEEADEGLVDEEPEVGIAGEEEGGDEGKNGKGKGKGKGKKAAKKLSKKEKKELKKKEKKEKILDKHGRPIMLIVGDLADGWERWANAFSPTAPFGSSGGRSVVLSILLPTIISTSGIFSEYVFSRVVGGFIGFLFFGQPILDRFVPLLDEKIPNWQEKMELRNGILAGVPTNAQLSLRLLREAELRLRPLPPPPPPPAALEVEEDDDDDTETSDEFSVVETPDGMGGEDAVGDDGVSVRSVASSGSKTTAKEKAKGNGKAKLASFIKSAAKFTEESAGYVSGQKQFDWEKVSRGALEKLNVSTNNPAARGLLAVMPTASGSSEDTPSTFFVNHSGRPGHIIIQPPNPKTLTPARILFTTVGNVSEKDNYAPSDASAPPNSGNKGKLTIPINDLIEIRKHGMGWQGRMIVSWAMGLQGVGGTGLELKVRRKKTVEVPDVETEVLEGGATQEEGIVVEEKEVETTQVEEEETFKFGAIVRRDELFCRLIACGDQRWEAL
ncbi:hypothetical protein BDY24DRAFT_380856 [Mrakia frigida]|uniref:uncharacterized protein n=1 Tax=Mrakia frigida TaxID=29902 RepID=UPI003FCC1B4A